MEAVSRKPLQGIGNILRFNWHFYAAVIVALAVLHLIKWFLPPVLHPFIGIVALLIILTTVASLFASVYVYDLSGLYDLNWLKLSVKPGAPMANIHAGFDETSALLAQKYPQATLTVFDFYDPKKHTEVSIKRARKVYPPYPGTRAISTINVPLPSQSVDAVFCILSAHEIREDGERSFFFAQLREALKSDGRIVVVEHLRDLPNFLAYSIGAFHFHSGATWRQTFSSAGLCIERQQKLTPFITVYTLQKNGNPS